MKNIFEKVKRFGSPIQEMQRQMDKFDNANRNVLSSSINGRVNDLNELTDEDNYDVNKYANEETPHKKIFTEIYEKKMLGDDRSTYYPGSCGPGATYDYNRDEFIPFLRQFIIDNQIKSVADLGCGNLGYDKKLYSEVAVSSYYGYDVYNKVQEHNHRFSNHKKYHFFCMDFLVHRDELVPADLCIIKDVLQHWLLKDITTLLDYLVENKKYKYIMIVNCYPQDGDWKGDMKGEWIGFKTGDWRKMSCAYLPLCKYHPKPVLYYKTKEVSIIQCYLFKNTENMKPRYSSPYSKLTTYNPQQTPTRIISPVRSFISPSKLNTNINIERKILQDMSSLHK